MPIYETATYDVLSQNGKYEIRSYPTMVTASVSESSWMQSNGFSAIFDYISGNNMRKEKISMTTPVINDLSADVVTTEFVMPRRYAMDTLPQPKNQAVQIKQIAPQIVASFRFSGRATPEKLQIHKVELQNYAVQMGYNPTGLFRLARYNPPFTPPLFRRNELLLSLKSDVASKNQSNIK